MCVCRNCVWEMNPEFVWDLSASARWTHTLLSFKRSVWLSIMDAGPPWGLLDCGLTAYLEIIINVINVDLKHTCFSICVLNLRHRSNLWVYCCSEAEWWSVSGDWSTTGQWLCCRLWRTMLLRRACRVGHVLVLVLCLSSAEDFDWTKNDHGSFYYGTFPAGKDHFSFNFNHKWWH